MTIEQKLTDIRSGNISESVTEIEMEYVFFAKVKDIHQLEQRANWVEKMEQWEMKSENTNRDNAGSIRVRSIDDKEYILTTKRFIQEAGMANAMESEIEVPKEIFNDFKYLCPMGTIKKRYYFEIEKGLEWEVDVYFDLHGKPIPWVKIDLEVKKRMDNFPVFPFDIEGKVITTDNRTPEEDKFVTDFI